MRRCLAAAPALACLLLLGAGGAARGDELVVSCGPWSNTGVFGGESNPPVDATANCPGTGYGGDGSGLLLSPGSGSAQQGQNAIWQATAPPGLTIVDASVTDMGSESVNAGNQGEYGGDFYWAGGTSNITPGEVSFGTGMSSSYFGIQLVCGLSKCSPTNTAPTTYILAQEVTLNARETIAPQLSAPTGLWLANGWVRGNWPLYVTGDSPSGLCAIIASLNGQGIPGSFTTSNPTAWHQCATPPLQQTVNTPGYPQGANTLKIAGYDAAGLSVTDTKTVYIDNQPPTIALTGPAQAPSTAGTQYVTATATAGPSGVAGISCSVDGAPAQWYAASSAQIPVNGVGQHQVKCVAENNAVDGQGAHGASAAQTFVLSIGTPTVAAIAFSDLVDRLRCHHITERVRIPARWVTVKVHGSKVRVRERERSVRVKVTKCHARTVRERRTVWVRVDRHGKRVRIKRTETVRVVVLPHVVDHTQRRVAHGQPTSVDGWLGTYTGVALADQPVQVLTAPDNGSGDFTLVTTTTTQSDGAWIATLPAGPSRLVEAIYPGASNVLGSLSTTVRVTVPAKVKLISVTPRRVVWGGTVRLVGQLQGGYLPPGGALVRLRIGEGKAVTTYGVREHVAGNGRFATTYTFGAGYPSIYRSFWFQIASLPISSYPWAPANSRRITVLVGGHPTPPSDRHHRHQPKRQGSKG